MLPVLCVAASFFFLMNILYWQGMISQSSMDYSLQVVTAVLLYTVCGQLLLLREGRPGKGTRTAPSKSACSGNEKAWAAKDGACFKTKPQDCD